MKLLGQNLIIHLLYLFFAGRINDTGVNAIDIMRYANETYSDNPNVETLWAGCQRTRDIIDADECGTDIITVPEGPLKKMVRIGNDIHNFSVRTSVDFSTMAPTCL